MKKILAACGVAAALLGATSCGNSGSSASADKGFADSLSNYLGMTQGMRISADYATIPQEQKDALKKDDILRGFKQVIMTDTTQQGYLTGLSFGLQLAGQLYRYEQAGIPVDRAKVYEAYAKAFKTDSVSMDEMRDAQATFQMLAQQMKSALVDLNFLEVQFEIQVRPNAEAPHADGYDEVEFMISTNPGEAIRPLGMVASGGELSRIMLALKTVLAKKDQTDTLIFDEIDAGISGKTAWKVSEKLGILGGEHQVICITHLPQIAAMADSHFLIEKNAVKDKTTTTIREIKEEESIKELARLLGSEEITQSALSNAKELKELAAKTKQS